MMNIDTLQQLTLDWRQNLDAQSILFRREAMSSLTLYLMDGASGNGNKIETEWAEEAQRRQSAFERRWAGKSTEFIKDHLEACWLEDHGVAVTIAMEAVVDKVYRKIFGVDLRWLADPTSLFEMLVREEVKLRQTFSIGYIFSCLRAAGHEERALEHLLAYVRAHLSLRAGTDLFRALQSAGHTDPRTGLWIELQAEVPLLAGDLSPRALRMLPGQAAYGIRKWLLPPVQEARTNDLEAFCAAQDGPTKAFEDRALRHLSSNNVANWEEEEHLKAFLRDLAEKACLTDYETEAYYQKMYWKKTETEIALTMGRAVGTIRSWHNRAKMKMKRLSA